MAWNDIDNLAPPKAPTIPPAGVRVSARSLKVKRGGKDLGTTRFIKLTIGAQLARSLGLAGPSAKLDLAFGTDIDAGKIRIATPSGGGEFPASRDKGGNYVVTINAATAEGLFALDFPAFSVDRLTVSPPRADNPPRAIFAASPEMLAVED
ncbi:MAG: hypothetical protein WBA75_11470 [Sphingopyxis granuli]